MPNYRNPNGYGSVTKLSGRRRNPYVVRKTVGYDDRAYPIYEVIEYFISIYEVHPTGYEPLNVVRHLSTYFLEK